MLIEHKSLKINKKNLKKYKKSVDKIKLMFYTYKHRVKGKI